VNIEILGTGCAKCKKLYEEVQKAIAASGQSPTLSKVEKLEEIMAYGVMTTPAVVIDGQVKSSGRIPSVSELTSWITGGK
jgi:small redox-active disulfide protein 2